MTSDQLVHRRVEQGKAYSVRYDQVNAILLNEFLKEHRKGEEQGRKLKHMGRTWAQQRKDFETANTKLRKEMETVVAGLQEQAGKNSRMSDRVEMSILRRKLCD